MQPIDEQIEVFIVRYLQQEITEDELHLLVSWIHESEVNRQHFFELKDLFDTRRIKLKMKDDEVQRSWQRMYGKIVAGEGFEPLVAPGWRTTFFRSALRYAAIVLLAVGLGFGIARFSQKEKPAEEVAYNQVVVEKGGRANTVILSDGTRVVLNASTVLKYPTVFNAERREVYLEGEGYFEVAKNAAKPFVVKLKKQDVTVLGTRFNIAAYSNDSYTVTTLLSGRVALDTYNDSGEVISHLFLQPNQQARTDNSTGSVYLSELDAALSKAWTSGEYKFKDERLESIVRRLENYYNVKIHIANDSLKNILYTGTFTLDQNIRDVLRLINYEGQFTYRIKGKEIVLSEKGR